MAIKQNVKKFWLGFAVMVGAVLLASLVVELMLLSMNYFGML